MRKIEREMLEAVTTGRTCALGNTSVTFRNGGLWTYCQHGHMIAHGVWSGERTTLYVNLCGYNTVTTRSRLSALIRGLQEYMAQEAASGMTVAQAVADSEGPYRYPSGLGVSSRKGVIRLHDARGETIIDAHGWHKVEF